MQTLLREKRYHSLTRCLLDNAEAGALLLLHQKSSLFAKLSYCRELDSLKSRNRALTQQAIDLQRPTANGTHPAQPSLAGFTPISRGPIANSPGSQGPSTEEFRNQTLALEAAERRLVGAEQQLASLRSENDRLKGV